MKKELIAESLIEKINIKDFLEQRTELSSRRLKLLLKSRKITINGKPAYFDNIVRNGDKIIVDMAETGRDSTVPEDIPVDVIYEDDYFLAVNKPAGMLVHPTQNHPGGTLSNAVKHYLVAKGMDIPVRLANRIDMETSGLVVIAKSGEAHSALSAQFEQDSCRKYYIAVAEGCFEVQQGVIDKPIGIDPGNPIRRAVTADGQSSRTEYEVLEQYKDAALVRLKLITGRTHQIRVHLCSMGHPLLGDMLYGGKPIGISRQALHAYEMQFAHPFTKKAVKLQADMPQDMTALIDRLRNEYNHTGANK